MPKSLPLRFRNVALTLLGLGLGYLTLSVSTALLYGAFRSIENPQMLPAQFMAMSAVCGVVFSVASSYIAAFFARRSPVLHASLFALMMTLLYLIPSFLFGFRAPLFFAILNVAIVVGGSMIGGWLRYWQMNRQRSGLTLAES
ncbi:MAG: hypothetical protein AAFY54_09195 [Cyanobacteria bacterium J06648_10]